MNIQLTHHNSMGNVVNTVQADAVAVIDKYGMRVELRLDENGHVQVWRGGNGYPIESDHE